MNTATQIETAAIESIEPAHRATYSPEDNKLRIYPAYRLSAEEYARVKAAGFSWAPKQQLFVAPMWTPARADLCEEMAGEIDDEDTSLSERSEVRAERFTGYRANRTRDAHEALDRVHSIAGRFEFGQPILVGHHSEARARRDQRRMQSGMRRAVDMWDTADYWRSRAAGAIRSAKYKERPDVRARRIKGIEADLRKVEKNIASAERSARNWSKVPRAEWDKQTAFALYIAGHSVAGEIGGSLYSALYDGRMHGDTAWRRALDACARYLEHAQRWADHYSNRLEYERAMLAEESGASSEGAKMAAGLGEGWDIKPGGRVLLGREGWAVVVRVNRKDGRVCSVSTNARYCRVRGIEEVQAYEPPTEETAAAVATVSKLAPLCNYPSEGCATMTAADWAKMQSSGSGATRRTEATAEHAAHRRRCVMGYIAKRYGASGDALAQSATGCGTHHGLVPVFISDAKRTDPPALNPAPKPGRKSMARKIAEAQGVDTSSTPDPVAEPAPDVEEVARILREWGVSLWEDPDTCRTLDAAARLGWIRRPSVTQVEWTDAGVQALRAARPAEAARETLADFTAPSAEETRAEAERLQRANAAREARAAEAAPFEAVRHALKNGGTPEVLAVPQLFPTPRDLAQRMADLADIKPGERVLEPSAGTGMLLGAIGGRPWVGQSGNAHTGPGLCHAVEINRQLCARLDSDFPLTRVHCADFLAIDGPDAYASTLGAPATAPLGAFDVVLMNPPFINGADIRHILHARRFLKPGGRLVAICAAGPRQHAQLQPLADTWEPLPDGTFADQGTNVRTVLLTMRGEG